MKQQRITTLGVAAAIACIALVTSVAFGQPGTPANSFVGFPGAGVVQAGDLWQSILPEGYGPYYGEGGTAPTDGIRMFWRSGNPDRAWSVPSSHWPAAIYWTPYWASYTHAQVFHSDTNFNPTKKGVAAPATGNWGQVTFKSTVLGANDPARYYSIEPYFVDGNVRQHALYEAKWPTNIGCDVTLRAHGFSGPNWNNLNDFVIIEMEFKNTGLRDMDMNGVADAALADPGIQALTFNMAAECAMSVGQYLSGGRAANYFTSEYYTRMGGWIEDPDPDGNPWAFSTYYAGARVPSPTPGNFSMGYNKVIDRAYTDIWYGWLYLDVKDGGLPANRAQSSASLPSRNTIFGTHPIGTGAERGRYVSTGSGIAGLVTFTAPKNMFTISAGTFAKVGASRNINQLDLSPNPDFFASGVTDNVMTWVPKASPSRPSGDQKVLNSFDQGPFETGVAGKNAAGGDSLYPNGWGKWTTGYNYAHNFNGEMYTGVGPFRVGKDSSVTIVLAVVAGYRLEGIQKSVRAARWAYENNYNLPLLPPTPDMKVSNTLNKTVAVEWDNRAESDPGFAGYKIWRSSAILRKKWLDEGMRLVDRYQEQSVVGANRDALKKPVNPKFDAQAEVDASSLKGEYQPDSWGTWDLIKVIPKGQQSTVPGAAGSTYNYRYEDQDVVLGFSYYYYVSAYKNGTFTGPGGETTTQIETHSLNRNGATGLWQKTYPFAPNNANYPKTADGKKAIGGVQVVYSALAPNGDVATVGVRPNPYKRAALHDNFSNVYDHKLLFYNLPPQCKITILDVSGMIVDEINFTSSDPSRGSVFWDMFSKDGIEVASGLYVYVVESPQGGSKVGYFSILR